MKLQLQTFTHAAVKGYSSLTQPFEFFPLLDVLSYKDQSAKPFGWLLPNLFSAKCVMLKAWSSLVLVWFTLTEAGGEFIFPEKWQAVEGHKRFHHLSLINQTQLKSADVEQHCCPESISSWSILVPLKCHRMAWRKRSLPRKLVWKHPKGMWVLKIIEDDTHELSSDFTEGKADYMKGLK